MGKLQRKYLPSQLEVKDFDSIKNFFEELKERSITSFDALKQWLLDRSELESVLEEDAAWRYIHMSCDTANEVKRDAFNFFVTEIEPKISLYGNDLDKKYLELPWSKSEDIEYHLVYRSLERKTALFRDENIPIQAELQAQAQQYGAISGAMTVMYQEKELTLQQASVFLKENDRAQRKEVFDLIVQRREQDYTKLDQLLTDLITKRHQLAVNTGFENYRDLRHQELERFDYTVEDCLKFHEAISQSVLPLVKDLNDYRKDKLGLSSLRPWDMEVDPEQGIPLKPFETDEELLQKSIECFEHIRPQFASFLKQMGEGGFLDLGSRKGKVPGGYNYPLYESNIPFIFMNATGMLRDVVTLMHEGGHAIHSFLSSDLQLVYHKGLTSEIAELASMSMELISMEHWEVFFPDKEELRRAKRYQIESVIKALPWIANVDKFQHWLYLHPSASPEERTEAWKQISSEFSTHQVDYSGYEQAHIYAWQRQLHIYEIPFYYIEYGMAQLGAIAMWRNYKLNPQATLDAYSKALSLGYSRPITEIFATAGIKFDFSKDYISELMEFTAQELKKYS